MLILKPPPTNFGLFGGVTDAIRAISWASPADEIGSIAPPDALGRFCISFFKDSFNLACFLKHENNLLKVSRDKNKTKTKIRVH